MGRGAENCIKGTTITLLKGDDDGANKALIWSSLEMSINRLNLLKVVLKVFKVFLQNYSNSAGDE